MLTEDERKAQMEYLGKRLRDLAARQREQAERLGGEKPRPQLVLLRGGKDDEPKE
jgi:hypothetical protein